ncbi:hypothetical protein XENTR_v10006668 [Xenopus tropicalis]|nr:uncharacterized protein LOC100170425 [Xenopus tropicalis]XP_031751579.1 uncharacterized protein LOC100170425 isoform X2 [Xenopus tropicalis]XP_031751580.1 uncharacterized protein LOC100170425 isoform X2 [Xenopus tropicalis]AAI66968.1 LOC100170425 protein [Xenopus tropicalis]KAE8626583.1 hypothetical protein XENTR_v10006668 [Xenopus tropicalis]KAE8626584.1 hypothetical protein XENTR_v10006668 [Xenopus tropicalis]KAE8626585.1 hypothetical protein XENTR_v10006668 [Xenopus tropicalis]KAE86265|eukprot:NP_001123675.1 uncharacterized protein LOC100170425 [Xenopus tropicalis]
MWLLLLVVAAAMIFLYRWNIQRQILPNLTDKYVLITGCDSGFGKLLAKQLDGQGLKVLATCLTQKGAEELKKETSSRLKTVIMDVSDSESVSKAAQWVSQIVGNAGLWGLVNNAGIALPIGPNGWMKKEHFVKMIDVNLLGMVDVTLTLLPLIRRARGRIVNVSSSMGRIALFGGAYSISKHGVEAFSDCLRRELSRFGIKVSIIEPGGFKTSIFSFSVCKKSMEQLWADTSAETKECYGQQYLNETLQTIDELINTNSSKLCKVTNCMEHALTACHPWTRYSPGWDAKLFYIPLSYLPTVLSDYVASRFAPRLSQGEK